jgi:hypothetical protein
VARSPRADQPGERSCRRRLAKRLHRQGPQGHRLPEQVDAVLSGLPSATAVRPLRIPRGAHWVAASGLRNERHLVMKGD